MPFDGITVCHLSAFEWLAEVVFVSSTDPYMALAHTECERTFRERGMHHYRHASLSFTRPVEVSTTTVDSGGYGRWS